jgi:uncharacterized protein (DUF433 family)
MTAPLRTEHPHIVKIAGVAGGRPVIAGSRISVDFIARLLQAGEDPTEIIVSYQHLSPAAVYDAISYYFDHQDEIDRFIADSTLEAVAEQHGFEVLEDGRIVPIAS